MWQIFIPAGAAVIGLIGVGFLIKGILKASSGNKLMTDISRTIQQGAKAFLLREYRTVAILVVIVATLLSLAPFFVHNVGVNWQRGLKPALNISFSAGAVTGLSIVCIAFLGLVVVYLLFKGRPAIINGYAMGASLMALFARAGGGIYTKGADMGADLVGKVEAGIPEDDARNPAVIADNVGDNVGDVAGLGADLLESYVESIIATLAIAASIAIISLTYLPFYLAGWGILCSIVGVGWIKMAKLKDPQATLNGGTYVSAALMMVGSFFIVKYSVYYSSTKHKPVKELANSCKTGPAVAIVNGLSLGMLSTLVPVVVIAAATLIGFSFAGMYGVAMAALGMLSILGVTLAVDSYGPVADNA